MTTDRAVKKIIRARAARTGERYTAARRHVLKHLEARQSAPPDPVMVIAQTPAASPPSAKAAKGRSLRR